MPAGRPTKDTETRREIIITNILRGAPLKYACKIARVDPRTLRNWREKDKNFCEEIEVARASKVTEVIGKVIDKDPKFWLKNQAKDEFKEIVEVESTETRKLIVHLTGDETASLQSSQVSKQITSSVSEPED